MQGKKFSDNTYRISICRKIFQQKMRHIVAFVGSKSVLLGQQCMFLIVLQKKKKPMFTPSRNLHRVIQFEGTLAPYAWISNLSGSKYFWECCTLTEPWREGIFWYVIPVRLWVYYTNYRCSPSTLEFIYSNWTYIFVSSCLYFKFLAFYWGDSANQSSAQILDMVKYITWNGFHTFWCFRCHIQLLCSWCLNCIDINYFRLSYLHNCCQ
jgi:hypothetical protein